MYYVTLRFYNKKHGTYFVFNIHRFFFWGGGIFILYSLLVPGKKVWNMELFGLWRLKIGEVNIEILSRSFHGAREIVRDTEVVE